MDLRTDAVFVSLRNELLRPPFLAQLMSGCDWGDSSLGGEGGAKIIIVSSYF